MVRPRPRTLLFVFAVLSLGNIVRAADRPLLHPLFASDMVLQRDVEDPIWGWTEPGKQVTVSLNGKTATATADPSGKWLAKIGPFQAGGPYELTVSGPQQVKLTNVMVGDVWICSGQSNMEMGIEMAYDRDHEIAAANYPNLRLFTVPKQVAYEPKSEFGQGRKPDEAKWLVCTPQNIRVGDWGGFSAVAYFFGRDLHEKLNVPIGLVHTSWGGTIAEAWTSGPSLSKMADFRSAVEKIEQTKAPLPGPNGRPGNPGNPNQPTVLYNGMIAPLLPMAAKGAIWYQGESNAGRARQYQTLLPTLIRDWRGQFTGGDFPFFIVQLAGFMAVDPQPKDSQWAELREAQFMTAQNVGHSAIASAIDLGNTTDIHPKNKQEVGYRLSLDALAIACGQKVEYSGPVFKSVEAKGHSLVVHFDHADGGLAGSPRGFAIAGDDGHFVWADAKAQGDTVTVSAKGVDHPTAVRYAWANNPDVANLYNKAGLPAVPFRADVKSEKSVGDAGEK
jgi:sialate O-acetylesterase